MDLFRHCLDAKLIDRKKRPLGRVDGIILEFETNRQPRVAYVEVGVVTLADRLSVTVGRRMIGVLKKFGLRTDRYRIAWSNIKVGISDVTADVDAAKSPALEFEMWLRKKVIGRIPWGA